MNPQIMLSAVGMVAPGIDCVGAMAPWCNRSERVIEKQVANLRLPADIKLQEQRRMAPISRLALYAATQAVDAANARGRDAGLFVGLTHGSTSLLKEFHDYLFDYGPELASPNAFSNGVTGAALGITSKYLNLTLGGTTIVGYETCGLDVLSLVAREMCDGVYPFCVAGAVEEYSPLVEQVYRRFGWYSGSAPEHLPMPGPEHERGFGMSEAAVFFTCESLAAEGGKGCRFTAIDSLDNFSGPVDVIVSGAGGGPQDIHELEALRKICGTQRPPMSIIFPKAFFGETFAAGSLISVAAGWDILVNGASYPSFRHNPELASMPPAGSAGGIDVKNVLILSAGRTGEISAGLLSLV